MGAGGKGGQVPTMIPLNVIPSWAPAGSSGYGPQNLNSQFSYEQSISPAQTQMEKDYAAAHPEIGNVNPFFHWVNYGSALGYDWGTKPPDQTAILASEIEQNKWSQDRAREKYEAEVKAADRSGQLRTLDEMWAGRMDAENKAISDVQASIDAEAANAAVLGVDYNLSDAKKQSRIKDAFSNYWTDANETQLYELSNKYGNPEQEQSIRDLIEKGEKKYDWQFQISRGAGGKNSAASAMFPGASAGRTISSAMEGQTLGGTNILG